MYLILQLTKMRYLLVLAALCLSIPLVLSQKPKKLSPDAYVEWCYSPDFLWKNKDTADGISYGVRFVPKEFDIAKCALDHCEKKDILAQELKSIDNSFGFILDLACMEFSKDIFSVPGKTGMRAAERKLYLSNYIKGDLFGISATNDTIKCVSAIYEVNIPMRARVLFDLESTNDPIVKIVFRDRMINNRLVEFLIPQLTRKQLPTLNLKKYE